MASFCRRLIRCLTFLMASAACIFNGANAAAGPADSLLTRLLQARNFSAFRNRADELDSTHNGPPSCHWSYLRDLAPGYQEGAFLTTDRASFGNKSDCIFVLAFGDRIIDYLLVSYTSPGNNDIVRPPLSFRDSAAYQQLRRLFLQVYGAPMNDSVLYNHSVTYGVACGYDGTPPQERSGMLDMVKQHDRRGLYRLLQSTLLEEQIYAVEGFYLLKLSEFHLSETEMKLIKIVLQKKGIVYACQGCIVRTYRAEEFLSRFTF